METKMIWANLASNDLQKTALFYTDLGFKQNCQMTDELVNFIFSNNDFVINFFAPKRFETTLKGKSINTKIENEIIFSLSAESKEDVDLLFEKVKKAGGKIFTNPDKFEQGYTFGFADPDGHKFNFLYWPGI